MKKLLSFALVIAMILTVISVSVVGVSAQVFDTTVRIGNNTYVATIGDSFVYTVSFDYSKSLSTAQVEIPVNFSIIGGETVEEIKNDIRYYCPVAKNTAEVFCFDEPNSDKFRGYVMNFASDQGLSFSGGKVAVRLHFTVLAAGNVDMTAKIRDVNTDADVCVVDRAYNVKDNSFTIKRTANLSTENGYDLPSPRIIKFENVNGGIKMTWNAVAGASKYRVYVYEGTKKVKLGDTTGTTYTHSGLEDGVEYRYTVCCYGADGKQASGMVEEGFLYTYYAPPTITKFENLKKSIKILWTENDAAYGYRVFYKNGTKWKTLGDTDENSIEFPNPVSGTKYTFTVRALDARNNLLTSYNSTGWTTTYIGQPVVSSATNAYGGVKVAWGKVTGAAKYRVFRKIGTGSWKKLADTTALTYTDKTAASNTVYSYTVRCITSDGKKYTSSYDTTGKSLRYIAAPVISKKENTATGIKLTWSAVAGATKYRVFIKNGTSWKKLADTTAASYLYKTTASGKSFSFTVRCMNADGKFISNYNATGWSAKFIAMPKVSKLTNTKSGVKVTWAKVKGAVKYRVFRKTGSGGWKKLADTTAVNYIDKSSKKGTTYYYTVRCISSDGKSYQSAYDSTGKKIKCSR